VPKIIPDHNIPGGFDHGKIFFAGSIELAAQTEATHREPDGLPVTPARYAGGSPREKVSSHET
jgi:hypothetical protein